MVSGAAFAADHSFAAFGKVDAVDAAELAGGVVGDCPYFVPAAAGDVARTGVGVAAVEPYLLVYVRASAVFGKGKYVGWEG